MLYLHHVPGRLRVKLRRLKGDRDAGLRICDSVRLLGGVIEAVSNPATGSVIVHYDHRRLSIEELWQALYIAGVIDSPLPVMLDPDRLPALSQNQEGMAENLLDRLMEIAVEKAMEHSARALISALI